MPGTIDWSQVDDQGQPDESSKFGRGYALRGSDRGTGREERTSMVTQQSPTHNRPAQNEVLAPLERFFLARLSSLARRQAATPTAAERTTLAHAVFSTYLDCLDLGLDEKAEAVPNLELI